MLGQALAKSSKIETQGLKYWKKALTIVLQEWGLITDSAELEIENRSKCDLDGMSMNLHQDKM